MTTARTSSRRVASSASSLSRSCVATSSAFMGGRSRRRVPTPSATSRCTVMKAPYRGSGGLSPGAGAARGPTTTGPVRSVTEVTWHSGPVEAKRSGGPGRPGHVPAVEAVVRGDRLVVGVLHDHHVTGDGVVEEPGGGRTAVAAAAHVTQAHAAVAGVVVAEGVAAPVVAVDEGAGVGQALG